MCSRSPGGGSSRRVSPKKRSSDSITSKSLISFATYGPRHAIRPCVGGHRRGQPRRAMPRHALRAAVLLLEEAPTDGLISSIGTSSARDLTSRPSRPSIPSEWISTKLPLSRLARIPLEKLDDDRILALYRRAREWGVRAVTNRVARLIDAPARADGEGEDRADHTLRRTRPRCGRDEVTGLRRSIGSLAGSSPNRR